MAMGNAKPAFVCESCHQRRTGASTLTITGRRLCPDCSDELDAAAAGAIANPGNPVGGAIATAGWLAALRVYRRARRTG